ACIALKQVGEGEFLSLIESAKQKGQLERYQAKRLKDKIKELANLPDLTEPEPAILELDQKVKQAARHYR
ncbi:MAG: hypothetical protein HGB11_03530, partial [Chlorobiales bacterium]|nr:hypothetical protein [Chlorobiales bacterium]